jgi:hypothetical protein
MDPELDWIQTYLAKRGPAAQGHRYPIEFRHFPDRLAARGADLGASHRSDGELDYLKLPKNVVALVAPPNSESELKPAHQLPGSARSRRRRIGRS